MDEKRILKYFSQKSHSLITLIAVLLLCLGFCVILLLPPSFWALGLLMMLAGALMFIVLSVQIKDSEVDEAVAAVMETFRKAFEEQFIYYDTRKLHQAELHGQYHKEPIYASGYLTGVEGLLIRRGNDSKTRTSVYQCVGILEEEDSIRFHVQNFSLVGGGKDQPQTLNIAYTELSRVALGESFAQMHLTTMEIYGKEGNDCLLRFQMPADAKTDDLVADINAKIHKAHEE